MIRRRWFAIRVGDFVEVRSTIKGIKKITSTHTYKDGSGKPFNLTQVSYEGGKLVTTWEWWPWFTAFNAPHATRNIGNVPHDGCVEILDKDMIRRASSGGSITWMS